MEDWRQRKALQFTGKIVRCTVSMWTNAFATEKNLINITPVPALTPLLYHFPLFSLFPFPSVAMLWNPRAPFWAAIHNNSPCHSLKLSCSLVCLWSVPLAPQLHDSTSLVWFLWISDGSHNTWHIVGAQLIFTEWINEYLMVDIIWKDGVMNMCASHSLPVLSPNQQNWLKSVKTGGYLCQLWKLEKNTVLWSSMRFS